MAKNEDGLLYQKTAYLYDLDPRPIVKDDIPFYLQYAAKTKGNILELASGSGRITIPLAEAGHDVWGVDLSKMMMKLFKKKIKRLPENISQKLLSRLVEQNMSRFRIKEKFSLIIIPFRSFQVLTEKEDQIACLQSVYNHLLPNGLFIITLMKPLDNIEKKWVQKNAAIDWKNTDPKTGDKIRRSILRKAIIPEKQLVSADQIYYVEKKDGAEEKIVEEGAFIKYHHENQIRTLINDNGFEVTEEMGYYDGRPIAEGSEFIFICRIKPEQQRELP